MDHTPHKQKGSLLVNLIILVLGLAIAIGGVVAVMVAVTYPKLPSMDELRNYQPKLPLQVYSVDGVLLGQFGQEHRIYIDRAATPQLLVDAILSAEDERFYEHGGIDFLGIIRAALGNIMTGHIQSGASTITMQVARNFFLTSQKTFTRKFNEILLSYKMEHSLTKDQILSLYINQIYLGQRAYGFAEAAETYFGKPLKKLTIAEYAVLAGLPKAPSAYNPVVNPKRARERQLYVLARMLKHGYISQAEYETAVNQKIVVVKGSLNDATDAGGFIAEMARQYLYPTYGDAVYTQGFKVYTTINSKLQQAAYIALRKGLLNFDLSRGYLGPETRLDLTPENGDTTFEQEALSQFDALTDYGNLRAAIVLNVNQNQIDAIIRDGSHVILSGKQLDGVRKSLTNNSPKPIQVGSVIRVYQDNESNQWKIGQIPQVQGALVALNPKNGAIMALMGGFDYTYNSFNHVMQAYRQPGSSFKPFIYSAALDKGYTTATIIDDSQACYAGGANGSQWCPKNDDGRFLGPISLRQALTLSRNLVTVKILNSITPQYAINYVSKFGFQESQFQPYLTMALGANEVTPMQMAQAYAVFANGGYLIQPYFIDKITDASGKILAQTAPVDIHQQEPAIDPRNAFIMNSILQDVAHFGTGARAGKALQRNDIAGKTGTTNDSKDVWFDGYTPGIVAVTWVGYDQPRSLGRQYGATLALPIWIDFMRVALANQPQQQLAMPEGLISQSNATWKGGTEYFYSNTPTMHVEASGAFAETNESDSSDISISSEHEEGESNQVQENSNHNDDINDIIKNIQD